MALERSAALLSQTEETEGSVDAFPWLGAGESRSLFPAPWGCFPCDRGLDLPLPAGAC